MFLPSLPGWDGLHPLVVHFPIALLLVAPIFVVLGLVLPRRARGQLVGALILMVLGTAGAWVATSTGEAGAELVKDAAVENAIEHHEELAEAVPVVFTILTLAFAALLVYPRVLRRPERPSVTRVLTIGFLIAYLYGATVLANAAQAGGQLVHVHGVQARIASGTGASISGDGGEHDHD